MRFLLLALAGTSAPLAAQEPFTLDDVLSPAFPFDLVAAREVDRIAWIEYERGARNVYTAVAPGFEPVRLTDGADDDGRDLSELQISDDGSTLVFLRGHTPNRDGWIANPTSDVRGAERAIWAARTDGGEPWRVAEGWNAALSPDGRWVAWVKDGQIHRAAVDPAAAGGDASAPEPLVRAFGDNDEPVWAPDSRRLAFVSDREDHSFVGVYDPERPGVTWLSPSVDRDVSPTWSPDGTRLAFVRRPGVPFGGPPPRTGERRPPPPGLPEGLLEARFAGDYDVSIWVADVGSGAAREVWHSPPGDTLFAEMGPISWAGDHVVFQAEPAGWRHYYSVSVDEPGPALELTPGAGIAEHVALAPDGRTLFYTTNAGDIDRRHLWRVPTAGGEAEQLTRGEGIETWPAALASGERVALLSAGARRPQSVALVGAAGGEPEVLGALPDAFPLEAHVVPEAVTLTAADGVEFHNQLFLPPDLRPGERRPALVFIHGGSRRQMLLGYHYMHFYHMAYAVDQYFANQGYVVLSVNYRSGIGYGRAFRNAPGRGREGNSEYQDVLAAGRWLQARPDVDPERVGVWGLSYGGILTAQALARNSDVFAAGVDMAGVHLWGDELDPESVAYQASSLSEVERWTSPVLLIHGDDDRNVDFSQTVGLVQALRAHDVPFELIVFPDEVHDFLLHARWLRAFGAAADFFERTLVRKEGVATDGDGGRAARPRGGG
jgi:dipeptidyl aminopeptidase/acylaminoacyl peptidase